MLERTRNFLKFSQPTILGKNTEFLKNINYFLLKYLLSLQVIEFVDLRDNLYFLLRCSLTEKNEFAEFFGKYSEFL